MAFIYLLNFNTDMTQIGYTCHFMAIIGQISKPRIKGTRQGTRLAEVACQLFLAESAAVTTLQLTMARLYYVPMVLITNALDQPNNQ